ncbi:MAG: DNRLRE domain-containing protein [Chloroflexi bacterium]|nr:DNRLRE domain-containing protein [Chloroflexota bacterium]
MKHLKPLAPAIGILIALGFLVTFYPLASAGAENSTSTFTSFADAYVSKSNPNTNYGSTKKLYVDNSPVRRTYLRFVVSGLNGAGVSSAKLRIYANSHSSSGFEVHALANNEWQEKTITYANAPAPGNLISKSGSFRSEQWVEIDLTQYIRGEGSFNFVLTTPSETDIALASRESGDHAPRLVLALAQAAPTATIGRTLTVTATSIVSQTPTTSPSKTVTATSIASQTPTKTPSQTTTPVSTSTPSASGSYVLLGWNDLGMHCYNHDFQNLAILPPFNNLIAQVIKRGDPPQIVTTGVKVQYSFPNNTYSAGKTNFWTYAQKLFGLSSPLPLNIGLTGNGLAGQMAAQSDHFVASGIPLTEFSDSAPTTPNPYQQAQLVAKDANTGALLASLTVVAPVSTEMHCDTCHKDGGVGGISTGKVETNILTLHDQKFLSQYPAGHTGALMNRQPVLCAECHSDNALGQPGVSGVLPLATAMHTLHDGKVANTLDGCYSCHPGPSTKCLRDVMYTDEGVDCISCHGTLAKVKTNPSPWLNEPRCDTCHGSRYTQNQALYHNSTGHGGVYCEACHDSPHAIAPSSQPADAIKFNQLQGHNGPLNTCTVCHLTQPTSGSFH